MAGIATGLLTWWPISLGAAGGWFTLVMLGYRRSTAANAYLAHAFPDAKRETRAGFGLGLRGTLDEMPFVVRNELDTMRISIGTPIDPGVTIDRRWDGSRIGDPEFDARFSVFAVDSTSELAWRMMLVPELRAELCRVFGDYSAELASGWFDIVIDDEDADGPALERLIRDGIALGIALWKRTIVDQEPLSWFVEHIPQEPLPDVRLVHFEWLVTGGWEVPMVLLLAAKDPDPEIQRWAQEQRPTETEYR
jgi:hypothetical protein